MVSNIIANNLKELLREKDMLPAELATKMGVSRSTVSMWLKGSKMPRMDKIEKMCVVFHCDRNRILAEKVENPISAVDRSRDDLFDEYRVLFDLTTKVKPEDLEMVKAFLERITSE